MQTQEIGDPSGGRGGRGPRADVQMWVVLLPDLQHLVVGGKNPHEDPRVGAAQAGWVDPGLLQRLPGDLQQQTLLGIQHRRLFGGDLKKRCVEPIDLADEPSVVGHHLCIQWHFPPIGGDRRDGVDALGDQLPEFLRRISVPRKTAAHADHGDRFFEL